jgi:small subunit ribosomal protein S1
MNNDDQSKLEGDLSMKDFEKSLEESFRKKGIEPGEIVKGKVVSATDKFVFLDIGAKSEGIINREELIDESGNLGVSIGDSLEATVMSTKDEILLSIKMTKHNQTRQILQDAFENRVPVEGRVADVNKGGFVVDLGSQRAFCPISQIDTEYVTEPQLYVGKNFHFFITRYNASENELVVSRSALLKKEAEEKARETLKILQPGVVLQGTVKRIINIGAFVDIGGLDGLIHISELSWDRVEDPAEVVAIGQVLNVKVLNIDYETKRISLSLRETQGNPWDVNIGTNIIEGNTYNGKVMRLENYGAFVSLVPGVQGLLHISEMSWGKSIRHPQDILKENDDVLVKVLSIDHDKKRISLGMKQLAQDPWDEASEMLQSGNTVIAEVCRISRSGLEVLVRKDVTGFVPASKTGISRNENFTMAFKIGQQIPVQIVEADKQSRRLILAIVDPDQKDETKEFQDYSENIRKSEDQAETSKMGSFGRILAKAIEKKKQKGN